jgi:SAM-dependent methyltransferase
LTVPEIRITSEDLAWWNEFALSRDWTFAKTYADSAPHHYIVENRTPGVSHDDIVRAARVIQTFGSPGKYYALTKTYLVSPDGRYRWWTEDKHFTDATLVNRATTDRLYGIQNAPVTSTGKPTPFDEVATSWDAVHPINTGEAERVKQLLAGARGTYPPHVLDLGCGTGRVLDLGLATPERYAAADSSRAMLNLLLRKHPRAAVVYPADVRDLIAERAFTPGQFDWVFLDSTVELDAEQRSIVERIARLAFITVGSDEWTVYNVAETSRVDMLALASEMRRES